MTKKRFIPWMIGAVLYLAVVIPAYWNLWHRYSPSGEKAEREALSAQFLTSRLPTAWGDGELALDLPDGRNRSILPTITSDASNLEVETKAIVALAQAVGLARQTPELPTWNRIGELRMKGSATSAALVVVVYATPKGGVGFRKDGISYLAEGQRELLAFLTAPASPQR